MIPNNSKKNLRLRELVQTQLSPKRKRGRPSTKQILQTIVHASLLAPLPTLDLKDLDRIGAAFIAFEDCGPSPTAAYNFPVEDAEASLLVRHGIYFMTVLGQGDAYHQGFYGSFPVCELEDFIAYLYSFHVDDPYASDPRALHSKYVVLVLYFPRSMANFLYFVKVVLAQVCQHALRNVTHSLDLSPRVLEKFLNNLCFALKYSLDLLQSIS